MQLPPLLFQTQTPREGWVNIYEWRGALYASKFHFTRTAAINESYLHHLYRIHIKPKITTFDAAPLPYSYTDPLASEPSNPWRIQNGRRTRT